MRLHLETRKQRSLSRKPLVSRQRSVRFKRRDEKTPGARFVRSFALSRASPELGSIAVRQWPGGTALAAAMTSLQRV
ncbi:hypothetical protein HN011_011777, partial [Eciton burchellii]